MRLAVARALSAIGSVIGGVVSAVMRCSRAGLTPRNPHDLGQRVTCDLAPTGLEDIDPEPGAQPLQVLCRASRRREWELVEQSRSERDVARTCLCNERTVVATDLAAT
jgi:hypothetical protein